MKIYAQNIREAKQQLDSITTFSKDIKIEFGIEKCSYINIEGIKKKSLGVNLCLTILKLVNFKMVNVKNIYNPGQNIWNKIERSSKTG